jgi:hypothetical protein
VAGVPWSAIGGCSRSPTSLPNSGSCTSPIGLWSTSGCTVPYSTTMPTGGECSTSGLAWSPATGCTIPATKRATGGSCVNSGASFSTTNGCTASNNSNPTGVVCNLTGTSYPCTTATPAIVNATVGACGSLPSSKTVNDEPTYGWRTVYTYAFDQGYSENVPSTYPSELNVVRTGWPPYYQATYNSTTYREGLPQYLNGGTAESASAVPGCWCWQFRTVYNAYSGGTIQPTYNRFESKQYSVPLTCPAGYSRSGSSCNADANSIKSITGCNSGWHASGTTCVADTNIGDVNSLTCDAGYQDPGSTTSRNTLYCNSVNPYIYSLTCPPGYVSSYPISLNTCVADTTATGVKDVQCSPGYTTDVPNNRCTVSGNYNVKSLSCQASPYFTASVATNQCIADDTYYVYK